MSYKQRLDDSSLRLLNMGCQDQRGANYGSFDRSYWHLRQRDFSSSIYQMASLPLLRSSLAANQNIKDFLIHSLTYLEAIQHRDGSFDEWYPNERGWGGPTSYILDFLARTFLEFSSLMSEREQKKCLNVIRRAAEFTTHGWERDVLYNHVALAVLSLEACHQIDRKLISNKHLAQGKDWLSRYFDRGEGWGREYDGADPGYQTASLSFLSKAHKLSGDSFYRDICLESLEFIKYFHYPDGSFSHGIGSRETSCVFDYGVHYWRDHSKVASSLSQDLFERKCGLDERTLDDHYFVYRMLELSDCIQFQKNHEQEASFSQSFQGRLYLERAQILILGSIDSYSVVNISKGGAALQYNRADQEWEIADYGVTHVTQDSITSTFVTGRCEYDDKDEAHLEVRAPFYRVKSSSFSLFTNLIFRFTLLLFAWNSRLAYFLKSNIRALLTTKNEATGSINRRTFKLSAHKIVAINDYYEKSGKEVDVYSGGVIENRYVPQSKYQSAFKLKFRPERKTLGERK